MSPSYPHFIIIGAPKCGTSWLAATLGQHPSVIVVPDEIEYFSTHRRNPVDWYLDKFDEQIAAISPVKAAPYVLGEKSAAYCIMSPRRIYHAHRLLPDVRLVLMLRDPVALLWSNMKQRFAKRHYAEREGGDVLSIPRERMFELLEQTRRFGELGAMIDNWTAVYPAEQLLLVSQEHTLADPRATFDAVLEHVGASTRYDPAAMPLLSKQTNRGPAVEMPDDVRDYLEAMVGVERELLGEIFRDTGVVSAASMPERPGRAIAVALAGKGVASAVKSMGKDRGFRSFEEALRSWIATVAITEVGFEGGGEKWTQELIARDYLAELRRRCGSDWPERWDDLIAPWDERFRAATVEEEGPHPPSHDSETGWWHDRRPRR